MARRRKDNVAELLELVPAENRDKARRLIEDIRRQASKSSMREAVFYVQDMVSSIASAVDDGDFYNLVICHADDVKTDSQED